MVRRSELGTKPTCQSGTTIAKTVNWPNQNASSEMEKSRSSNGMEVNIKIIFDENIKI